MTKTKVIRFVDMRRLLKSLGYKERLVDKAHGFVRSKTDMLIFRQYGDADAMRPGDVDSTREYLDLKGVLEEAKFDSFFESANKSA